MKPIIAFVAQYKYVIDSVIESGQELMDIDVKQRLVTTVLIAHAGLDVRLYCVCSHLDQLLLER